MYLAIIQLDKFIIIFRKYLLAQQGQIISRKYDELIPIDRYVIPLKYVTFINLSSVCFWHLNYYTNHGRYLWKPIHLYKQCLIWCIPWQKLTIYVSYKHILIIHVGINYWKNFAPLLCIYCWIVSEKNTKHKRDQCE